MLLSLINNVTAIRKRKPAQGKCKITPFNLLCIPDKQFLFKVSNGNTRKRFGICSTLTMKSPE